NDLPDWFFDAVEFERDWALDYCLEVLGEEAKGGKEYWKLPHLFSGRGNKPFVREVCEAFILNQASIPLQGLRQLLRVLAEGGMTETMQDLCILRARTLHTSGEEDAAMLYAAAVFKIRQQTVWNWVVQQVLIGNERVEKFRRWLNSLESMHAHFDFNGHWPAWMETDVVAAMVPWMFEAFPPENDVESNGVISGEILRRHQMGQMRDNAFLFIADSGEERAGQHLKGFLSEQWSVARRSLILHSLDHWKEKYAEGRWHPLAPSELIRVLNENAVPIRSAEDLYAFCGKALEEVRLDIERGEASIRSLLWNDDGSPKDETAFQRLVFDKLRGVMARYQHRIVAGREIDIAGNFPDIFVSVVLPSGQQARVFIEMKRQQHDGVVRAIQDQLIDKYLTDVETSHGIYLVGWYGEDFFG
ncbi:MAG: hypothetical protein D6794_02625, partial [Deltaproteobacteria bacterium]